MRKKLIAGNWKLHGSRQLIADLLPALVSAAEDMQQVELAVFPPFPYLSAVDKLLSGTGVGLGAQNMSEYSLGAYTGEVSADMLLESGCRYVLCGHSERRSLYAENDQVVAAKVLAAQKQGLIPVLCLGETLAEREAGQTEQVVCRQLAAALDLMSADQLAHLVVAYEPVWAIGTGKTASPEQAQNVHHLIRSKIAEVSDIMAGRLRILYGGSVKPDNAASLFAMADIDGGLIGGASLKAQDFLGICRA